MSGSLGYQIEHHLFPDLPINRYPEIAAQARELCRTYRLPYTIGPLHRQNGQTLRTLLKLSLPGSSAQRRRRGEGRRTARETIEELRRYNGPTAPQAAVS